MPFRLFLREKRRSLSLLLTVSLAFQTVSCGTILHPERQGQPGGRLDPAIVALNGIGLLLFIVPGAVAFAVDFYNGTIYLPPDEYRSQSPDEFAPTDWNSVTVDREIKSQADLEAYLFEKTGREVELDPNKTHVASVRTLPDLERIKNRPMATPNQKLRSWNRYLPVLPSSNPQR